MVEIDYKPSAKSQELLNFILSKNMPWYLQGKEEPVFTPFFFHGLMTRSDTDYAQVGTVNSSLYEPCKDMFLEACDQASIEVKDIYRACINTTFYHPEKHTGIHVDHDFPHKNFIMYLNDTAGPTYVFNEKNEVIAQSTPKKNRVVYFGGELHAQGSCEAGESRTVLVVTFN